MTASTLSTNPVTTVKVRGATLMLDEIDMTILSLLAEHKFLTTQQVARFLHVETRLFSSSVRIASRRLNKLDTQHIVTSRIGRQVGGIRQGSEPHIWHLAKLGHDALEKLRRVETGAARKAFKAPRYTFARHRIAINDTKLLLRHIAAKYDNVKLGDIRIEEKSWISYTDRSGALSSLRPDMYAETYRDEHKKHWFIEVDCNTEAPVRIIAKCNLYIEYLLSTRETAYKDWCCGVFPAVLWVVPSIKRRDSLQYHIARSFPDIPKNRLFIVVTPQELPALIGQGKLGELQEVVYEAD